MDVHSTPLDIWYNILNRLSAENLIKMITVSKLLNKYVKSIPWSVTVTPIKLAHLNYLKTNYLFERYDLSKCKSIQSSSMKLWHNLKSLNLDLCKKIPNTGLQKLSGLLELNISSCLNITVEGLSHLSSLEDLNIFN